MLATKPNDEAVHETYIAAKREEGILKDELDAETRTFDAADGVSGLIVFFGAIIDIVAIIGLIGMIIIKYTDR